MKTHKILNEVSMSPTALQEFLKSPQALGIRAGFEAELCFPINALVQSNKKCKSIDQIIEFFNTGPNNTNEEITKLESALTAELDEFRIKNKMALESDFLKKSNYNNMSDIVSKFNLNWPDADEAFNYPEVVKLAMSMHRKMNVKSVASDSHSDYPRDSSTWILEPDETIEPDGTDIGVEIVTPPMPLSTCLENLIKFATWATANRAYANESTGFHVGVSLPKVGGNVDYIKLALFLGDEYLLDQFNRASNVFCKKAATIITNQLSNFNKDEELKITTINKTLELLRSGMYNIANHFLAQRNTTKYVSINIKPQYVEFRTAGNRDYLSNIPKLQNTILRYAYAMSIAADPTAYNKEYAKKLYKFLDSTIAKSDTNASTLISDFMSNKISIDDIRTVINSKRKS